MIKCVYEFWMCVFIISLHMNLLSLKLGMDEASLLIPSLNYMMDEVLHVLKMNSYFLARKFITNVIIYENHWVLSWMKVPFYPITQLLMDEGCIFLEMNWNSTFKKINTNVIICENHSMHNGWSFHINPITEPMMDETCIFYRCIDTHCLKIHYKCYHLWESLRVGWMRLPS